MNRPEADDIVQALRGGLVPRRGLHHLATGMEPLMRAVEQELDFVATGKGIAKWIRGEYGSGKTFATRLLCARARERGFATSEVQTCSASCGRRAGPASWSCSTRWRPSSG